MVRIIWKPRWCALSGMTFVNHDHHLPIVLAELQVSNQDLMVDICPIGTRPEEVDTIQVGDIDTPTT